MPSLIIEAILVLFAIIGVLYIVLSRKGDNTEPQHLQVDIQEKIYVSPKRVYLICIALWLLGAIFLCNGILFFSFDDITSVIVPLFLLVPGFYLTFKGASFFRRRSSILQLELTKEGIYHKPIKWYSHSRGGNVNPLSIFLSEEWCFTAYEDLSYVSFQKSDWTGDSIHLVPINGKAEKLLLLLDDRALIKEIHLKIHENIKGFKNLSQ